LHLRVRRRQPAGKSDSHCNLGRARARPPQLQNQSVATEVRSYERDLPAPAESAVVRQVRETVTSATLDNVVILGYRALPEHRNSKHETVDHAARSTVGGIRQGYAARYRSRQVARCRADHETRRSGSLPRFAGHRSARGHDRPRVTSPFAEDRIITPSVSRSCMRTTGNVCGRRPTLKAYGELPNPKTCRVVAEIPKAFERNYLASPVVFPQPAGLARASSCNALQARKRGAADCGIDRETDSIAGAWRRLYHGARCISVRTAASRCATVLAPSSSLRMKHPRSRPLHPFAKVGIPVRLEHAHNYCERTQPVRRRSLNAAGACAWHTADSATGAHAGLSGHCQM